MQYGITEGVSQVVEGSKNLNAAIDLEPHLNMTYKLKGCNTFLGLLATSLKIAL